MLVYWESASLQKANISDKAAELKAAFRMRSEEEKMQAVGDILRNDCKTQFLYAKSTISQGHLTVRKNVLHVVKHKPVMLNHISVVNTDCDLMPFC